MDTEFKSRQSRYDRVFDGSASQQEVFDNCGIKHMIDMALDGWAHVTVLMLITVH